MPCDHKNKDQFQLTFRGIAQWVRPYKRNIFSSFMQGIHRCDMIYFLDNINYNPNFLLRYLIHLHVPNFYNWETKDDNFRLLYCRWILGHF